MADHLEGLLARIQQEGVEKAREEAGRIVEEARREAQRLLEAAREEAGQRP